MMGQLGNKYVLVNAMEKADIMVLNSCSFISAARQETIATLHELQSWKTGNRKIILTGCFVEDQKDSVFESFPFIDGILNTGALNQITSLIEGLISGCSHDSRQAHRNQNFEGNLYRKLATPSHYAYLKIGEGCSNACSFCTIPRLRGAGISKPLQAILAEAKQLTGQGVKELILISQDTTSYQSKNAESLADLIMQLETISDLEWIRLLYAHPGKITAPLIHAMQQSSKLVKYIDMPIQHINDTILTAMRRHTTKKEITKTIQGLRTLIPDVKLRTTVMVGFPGEDERSFQELFDYVSETKFDHLGVFAYSNESEAPSFHMRGQVSDKAKEARVHKLMLLQKGISASLNETYLGKTIPVMIDNHEGGRRYFDAPEIDGFVHVKDVKSTDIGSIKPVQITQAHEYDLVGIVT